MLDQETKDLLDKVFKSLVSRLIVIPSFFFLFLPFSLLGMVNITNTFYLLLVIIWLCALALLFIYKKWSNVSYNLLLKSFLAYTVLDLALVTIVIYYGGGITWLASIVYSYYIIFSFIVYSKIPAYFILSCSVVFMLAVTTLTYLEIIPFRQVFPLGPEIYKNKNFVIVTSLFIIGSFYWIGYYSNIFSNFLKEKVKEVNLVKSQLETEKGMLEIKVAERTKEIQEERESLEKKVGERTEELQAEKEELRKKIAELEKFHKVAVGRELAMVDLKKEINILKGKIKKNGGQTTPSV